MRNELPEGRRERTSLNRLDYPMEGLLFALARYKFACRQLDADDVVLELGCGEGFGAAFLARHVKSVTALDASAETIDTARERHAAENLTYLAHDATAPLPFEAGRFTAAVSFEVIEHLARDEADGFLAETARALQRPGVLFLSTPRAREDRTESRRRMHKHEYAYDELKRLLRRHFARVLLFSQTDEVIHTGHPTTAWTFMAVCFI